MNEEYKPTICLDFDGVMSQYTGWQGADVLDRPRAGLKTFLLSFRGNNFKVVIHTTRETSLIVKWLRQYNLAGLVDEISAKKPPAAVYLDDRAVCFKGDFGEAMNEIKKFKAYWEEEE